MWLQSWGCPVDVKFLRKAFRDIWIPEMLADVAQRLRFQLNRASRIGKLTAAQVQDAETISTTLLSWEAEEEPFTLEQYDRLFESSSIRELVKVTCSQSSRQQFAQGLFDSCRDSNRLSVSTRDGSWLGVFRHVVNSQMDQFKCVELIETALASVNIMWAPLLDGSPTLTVANLMVQTTANPISATAGLMKRSARQAEMELSRTHEPPRKRIINFGGHCDGKHEFKTMPSKLKQGFEEFIEEYAEKKKPEVARHFEVVQDYITRKIGQGSTHCSLMLMLVMTLAESSSTPWLTEHGRESTLTSGFDLHKDKKDECKFAAALATKMVWFLERAIFFPPKMPPKTLSANTDKKGEEPMASTQGMKRVLEHYKVSYWTLYALNWITVKPVTRPRPGRPVSDAPILRDEDCELRTDLDAHWEKLNRLRVEDPKRYLATVFGNEKHDWAKLCDSIFER
ncbi:uncharacterized protein CPUR_08692 [Claviceps purpurea 20.1]|uniref:Uncharacterized protein n=1 Tax=Claviceps purpurea (strain 20.1) TaxID=1111077 RepID=M1W6M7_CLAP2|nr:uncharacterized protein CPUR_08692 [Claviceps purpurea 20.1]